MVPLSGRPPRAAHVRKSRHDVQPAAAAAGQRAGRPAAQGTLALTLRAHPAPLTRQQPALARSLPRGNPCCRATRPAPQTTGQSWAQADAASQSEALVRRHQPSGGMQTAPGPARRPGGCPGGHKHACRSDRPRLLMPQLQRCCMGLTQASRRQRHRQRHPWRPARHQHHQGSGPRAL